jgi:hypothetical protein
MNRREMGHIEKLEGVQNWPASKKQHPKKYMQEQAINQFNKLVVSMNAQWKHSVTYTKGDMAPARTAQRHSNAKTPDLGAF